MRITESYLLPKHEPETYVKVLIVGAGFAGLMAALEKRTHRGGHPGPQPEPQFQRLSHHIQPSALEALRFWPQMCRELEEDKVTAGTYYYRHDYELTDGPTQRNYIAPEHVAERERRPGESPYCGAVQIWKKFYRMLLGLVARLDFTIGSYLSTEVLDSSITPRDEFLDAKKVAKEPWTPYIDPDEAIEPCAEQDYPRPAQDPTGIPLSKLWSELLPTASTGPCAGAT